MEWNQMEWNGIKSNQIKSNQILVYLLFKSRFKFKAALKSPYCK